MNYWFQRSLLKTEKKEVQRSTYPTPGTISPHSAHPRPDALHIQFKQHVVSDDIDTLTKFNKVTSGLLGYS